MEGKKTPLYEEHIKAGGKMVDFCSWLLPIQYPAGIVKEHIHTRTAVSLFDVSHMGEILVEGPGAYDFVQYLVTNDISKIKDGRAVYSPFCYENGTCVDDLLVYPYLNGNILLVVNAANVEKDYAWISKNAPEGVSVKNVSDQWAQLALQGPEAAKVMTACGMDEVNRLGFFGAGFYTFCGASCIISKTGYTGERGFEIYLPPEKAAEAWRLLLKKGAVPAGLGARDTLRFEACLPLYGHEISEEITPLEAGLQYFVKPEKNFIGRDAMLGKPNARKQIGLEFLGRGIPRAGFEVYVNGERAGYVTTGSPSPSTGKALALAIVEGDSPKDGDYTIMVRGKLEPAKIVSTPFYKKNK